MIAFGNQLKQDKGVVIMANGENTAKQIVIDEANALASKLENGHTGDLPTIGRLMVKHNKMLTSIYACNFVTVEQCQRMQERRNSKNTKIKIGPIEFEGKISAAVFSSLLPLLCCGVLGFALGKANGWW